MSNYKGFHSSYAAFIRQIRENLREGRYGQDRDCFGIFKELVQNADDAGAHHVHLGVSEPLPNARHPLLRAPGLFAINDGKFDSLDAEAIRCFSLNAKAADRSSIGKFGLGLKSIFHLGEAFFFLAGTGENCFDADVLNPWSSATGTGLHPDWDDFPDHDRLLLLEHLSPLLTSEAYFCMWVPLRRLADLDGKDPLVGFYPGDAGNRIPVDFALGCRLGPLLPLLARVEDIQGWRFEQASPVKTFHTRLEAGSRRRSRTLAAGQGEALVGEISVADKTLANESTLRFVGRESKPVDQWLAKLQGHASWPRDFAIDPATGAETPVAEKAEVHGAVVFVVRDLPPGERGRLRIQWSVFLPLSEPVEYDLGDTPLEVTLFLHGYFFVDAGRNRIEGIDQDEPAAVPIADPCTLRRSWNHRLARTATLPELPEVLDKLLEQEVPGASEDAIGAITGAIARSTVFERFRSAVCRDFDWARVLLRDGNFSWIKVPSGEPFYQIPPSDPAGLMTLVLPGLPALAEGLRIVRRDEPRLAGGAPEQSWPRSVIVQLLESTPGVDLVADERRLAYLAEFLDECGDPGAWSSFARPLIRPVKIGLRALGLSELRRRAEGLRSIIGRLPLGQVFPIDLNQTPAAERLFSELLDVDLPILIVPMELGPDHLGARATLASEDAERLVRHLQTRQEGAMPSDDRQMIAELAAQLIGGVNQPKSIRASCGDLAVLWGIDCRDRKGTRLTLAQLDMARSRGTLFVLPPSHAYSLQDALDGEGLTLVSKKLYLSLYHGPDAPSCREAQVLATLAKADPPVLQGPARRVKLLEMVLAYQGGRSDPNYRRSVRYLLHGRATNYVAADPLLVSEGGAHPVWNRIVDSALAHLGRSWRLIDPSLARRLSHEHREEFDVQVIGPISAIELMREAGPDAFGGLNPSDEEYAVLLRSLDDDAFCRALPIHLGIDGTYGPIDARTYLGAETELPEGLSRTVRLLAPSGQEAARNRQRAIARTLDPASLIRLVLEQDQPWLFANVILAALVRSGGVPGQVAEQLGSASWLPMRAGGFAKPCDVIHLPEIAGNVERLTADYPGVFLEPGALASWARESPGFPIVERDLFPNRIVSLSMLGTLLLEDERNHVGEIGEGLFDDWILAMQEIPASVLPCVPLLSETARRYKDDARRVFAELRRPIPAHRVETILEHLRDAHRGDLATNRKARLIRVYRAYLELWITRQTYLEKLQGIDLPTQAGGWRPTAELCWQDDGLSADHLLNPAIEHSLQGIVPESFNGDGLPQVGSVAIDGHEPSWSEVEGEVEAASGVLGDYFSPWQDIIPGEQVGGFLALLGDEPGMLSLAQAYLGKNRTIEETRRKFGLLEMPAGKGREDGPTMIAKQRVVVEVCQGATVRLRNILGVPIDAPKREVPPVLFLGYGRPNNPFPQRPFGVNRVLWFRLNEVDPSRIEPTTLSRLLRDSAIRFIGAAYNSYEHQTRFGAAWDELSESDQLDISIAQSRVVENGLLILDQLGLRSERRIAAAIDRWDAAQRLDAEQRLGSPVDRRSSPRSAARELDQAKSELKSILEEPGQAGTHQRILEAVRSRVGEHFQYEPDSVPFELFQNADDASVELVDCFPASDAARRDSSRFLVMRDAAAARFVHFGRRINQYPPSGSTTARTRGFDDDLWKMLVLSLSNKPAAAAGGVAPVTGKFGLGFKSVFLVSDRPRMLSGRLAFEITGGVYPRRLVGDERQTLDQTRTRLGAGQGQATVLELPIREDVGQDFLDRFFELAHFQVVFARQIRRIGFEPGGEEVRWAPTPVKGIPGCLVGTITPLGLARERGHETSRAILFHGEVGSLLFRIGPRGLGRFPDDVPTIWVTAPTRERLPLGFVVNGPFALDIGRAQIARDPSANRLAAEALGQQFGAQLTAFYDASSRSWDEVRSALGLASDSTFGEFWDSLWGLLAEGVARTATRGEPVDQLVKEVLWGGDRGFVELCRSRALIPSRLGGPYAPPVTLGEIRFKVRGSLADSEGLFEELLSWPSLQANAPAGHVVRDRGVAGPLGLLIGGGLAGVRPLTLAQVLAWEFEAHRLVGAEQAARLGSTLTRARLEQPGDNAERDQIRQQLGDAEFLAVDGHYLPARELLLGHRPEMTGVERQDDERLRARFAPASPVLATSYDAAGVEFFLACRERLEAPTRLLADWVLSSKLDDGRRAALEYLAEGELGLEIQRELKRRGLEGTWLERLRESPAFLGLDRSRQLRLGELLPHDTFHWNHAPVASNPLSIPRAPELILGDIHGWWSRERGRLLADYEGRIYPNRRRPDLREEGIEGRKGWSTLLLLGMTHTMGRTRAEAHRNFLARCDRQGWLEMFAASERAPERWMRFIDDYLSEQVDDSMFLQWMKQFIGIYQISRHLVNYVEIFRAIDRIGRPFSLTEVTVPNASVMLQGSGIEAPPLARTLGIGACFVIRELVRLGEITNPHAVPHCYTPVKRVRDLCMRLGCPPLDAGSRRWEMSREIYAFLVQLVGEDRATFGGDFDIPLQLIAEDESLQERFLQTTLLDDDDEEVEYYSEI